jgi:hypothetical protein
MLGFFIALLVGGFSAAVVGAVVTGLFWLTVVSFAVLLLTAALGLSLLAPDEEDSDTSAEGEADLVVIDGGSHERGRSPRDGGGLRRAA